MEIFFGLWFVLINPRLMVHAVRHSGKGHDLKQSISAGSKIATSHLVCLCGDVSDIRVHERPIIAFGALLMRIPYFERKILATEGNNR